MLPPGTGDLVVTARNTRNKSMFMGFLRFSARNKTCICYGLPEWFRLMFAEVVTTLRALGFLPKKTCKISLSPINGRNLDIDGDGEGDRGVFLSFLRGAVFTLNYFELL
jgi:hypothetical protein